jgi:hypothetical protein
MQAARAQDADGVGRWVPRPPAAGGWTPARRLPRERSAMTANQADQRASNMISANRRHARTGAVFHPPGRRNNPGDPTSRTASLSLWTLRATASDRRSAGMVFRIRTLQISIATARQGRPSSRPRLTVRSLAGRLTSAPPPAGYHSAVSGGKGVIIVRKDIEDRQTSPTMEVEQ